MHRPPTWLGIGVLAILASGCAAADRPQRQDVVFVVDSPAQIGRIEFSSDIGAPFAIALVPAGVTIYELRLRPGRYCLEGLAMGDLNVGVITRQRTVPCFDVMMGSEPYAGHLIIDRQLQISWAYHLDRYRAEQADPGVLRVDG